MIPPDRTQQATTIEARFWSKVDRSAGPDACWLWTACRIARGYGHFRLAGRMILAHRVSWELANGPIPDGLWALHRCDTPACVNPVHLFLGTHAANMADMVSKGRAARVSGERNGMLLHPDRRPRGDRNGMRLHPERRPRGERHGSRTKPECTLRGERNGFARLTESQIREIRARARAETRVSLAREYGVSDVLIGKIFRREIWGHVA